MAYCSTEDLKNALPEAQLIQLTDDGDAGQIDMDKLNDAIRRADDFIDGHLRGRYTLPITTVPALIRDTSIRLGIWFLYSRSMMLTMPESIKEMYKDVIDILVRMQQGKVNPFPTADEPTFYLASKTEADGVIGGSNGVTNNWNSYLI